MKGEAMLKEENSTRTEVISAIKKLMADEDHYDLPTITNQVVDDLKDNEEFVENALEELVRPIVYQMGAKVMAQTREAPVIHLGTDELVTLGEHKRQAAQSWAARFSRWVEHAGDEGYVKYLQMNKEQLLKAAREREKVGTTHMLRAAFNRRIAQGLDDGQVVGDVYTPEELERIYKDYEKQMKGVE